MPLYSSDVPAAMAGFNLRLLVEHAAPRGQRKSETITLRAADGKRLTLHPPMTSGVCYSSNLPIPRGFLDGYLRAGLVIVEKEGRDFTVYALTGESRARDLAARAA
jgi:hypothetical protein